MDLIKSLKKVSSKPDVKAKAFAFIVMTEHFVTTMCSDIGGYSDPEKTL